MKDSGNDNAYVKLTKAQLAKIIVDYHKIISAIPEYSIEEYFEILAEKEECKEMFGV